MLYEFQEAGYLPEAIVNFLTNVGWSFGEDREVFSVEETIERFDLDRVNPAASVFPIEKLDWLNGVYIREMDPERLAKLLLPIFEGEGYEVDFDVLRPSRSFSRASSSRATRWTWAASFREGLRPPAADALVQKGMDVRARATRSGVGRAGGAADFHAATQRRPCALAEAGPQGRAVVRGAAGWGDRAAVCRRCSSRWRCRAATSPRRIRLALDAARRVSSQQVAEDAASRRPPQPKKAASMTRSG